MEAWFAVSQTSDAALLIAFGQVVGVPTKRRLSKDTPPLLAGSEIRNFHVRSEYDAVFSFWKIQSGMANVTVWKLPRGNGGCSSFRPTKASHTPCDGKLMCSSIWPKEGAFGCAVGNGMSNASVALAP